MRAISLVYRDIVPPRKPTVSGFNTPGASRHKLDRTDFAQHLSALIDIPRLSPVTAPELPLAPQLPVPFLLTFDGGGRSAFTEVRPRMERLGWRVHFFVATAYIGKPGFLSATQIQELAACGHCIGSHTHTYPDILRTMNDAALEDEWKRSLEVLSETLGRAAETASVPGGNYTRRVARAAERAGVRWLFHSRPTTQVHEIGACQVIGRYRINHGVTNDVVTGLVEGDWSHRAAQWLRWSTKKTAQRIGGKNYLKLREWFYGS